jgi:peptide/nickel transport system permease protein
MSDVASVSRAVRAAAPGRPVTFWALAARRFLRHRLAVTSLAVMAVIAALALGAPLVAPHSPTAIDSVAFQAAPSRAHPLGSDSVGRDVLSRLIYAARVSLTVGVLAVAMYVVIGTGVGAAAAYYGGGIDLLLSRVMDVMLSFPPLIIILFAVSVFGRPSIWNVIIVLGLLGWPALARLVRGQFLALRDLEFVLAARATGASDTRVVIRHMLPNALAPVLVAATFGMANAILVEAALSFLGMGV